MPPRNSVYHSSRLCLPWYWRRSCPPRRSRFCPLGLNPPLAFRLCCPPSPLDCLPSAKSTRIDLPSTSQPSAVTSSYACLASSTEPNSTYAIPRLRPVSRSTGWCTRTTRPYAANASSSDSAVADHATFPTQSVDEGALRGPPALLLGTRGEEGARCLTAPVVEGTNSTSRPSIATRDPASFATSSGDESSTNANLSRKIKREVQLMLRAGGG